MFKRVQNPKSKTARIGPRVDDFVSAQRGRCAATPQQYVVPTRPNPTLKCFDYLNDFISKTATTLSLCQPHR
jgi:hypothetical protein